MSKPKYMTRKKTIEQYDAEYEELITHAVERYGDKKKAVDQIRRFLSRRYVKNFNYVNVHSRKIFRTQIKASVATHWPKLGASEVAYGFFTFIDKAWACNEHEYIDLDKIKRKVRKAMGGVSFIAVIEHAMYVNRKVRRNGKTGKMICVHVHAIAWDTSYRQLQRRRTAIGGRFVSPFASAKKAVHLSKRVGVDEFMGTTDYTTKMNLNGYRVDAEGKSQRAGKMSYRDHYNLFDLTCNRSLFDYWFAGGEGSLILRESKAACLGKRPLVSDAELVELIDQAREYDEDIKKEHKRQKSRRGKTWRTVSVRQSKGAGYKFLKEL